MRVFIKVMKGRPLWISFFIVLGLCAVYFLVLGRGANTTITNQLLQRQQTLARAQASNITTFFQLFGNSIAIFAQAESTKSRDAGTVRKMDVFVEQWRDSGLIGGIIFIDKEGIVRFISNIEGTRDVGATLSDRDYFLWAKGGAKEGEYFIGKPVVSRVGASKGKAIVAVASPVYVNEGFVGVIAASVMLDNLTQKYLELMKVSDETDTYLIDEEGKLIYSNWATDVIGSNVTDLLKENPFPGSDALAESIKGIVGSKQEGKLRVPYIKSTTGESKTYYAAYSPVSLGSQNWLLAMATPVEETSGFIVPTYIRLSIVLVVIILTFLLHGVVITHTITDREQKKLE